MRCILFLLTLTLLWLIFYWIKSDRNTSSIDISKTEFFYSANDTHCPIASFKEEVRTVITFEDECKDLSKDWIYVVNNYAIFNDSIVKVIGVMKCFYKHISWKSDFESLLTFSWTELINNTFLGNNVLLARCKGQSLFHYYERYLFGFENKMKRSDEEHLKDVLVIGIDSVSRLAWKRLLGKSYNYLEKEMQESSVIFKKINVLGDGTTVNILGILAGELEMEVYESRKGYPNAKHIDEYHWIWKIFRKNNFVTYYDEDDLLFGTFQYRLLGFETQPTNFYGRIWRMIRGNKKHSFRCINNKNIFQDQLSNVKTFFNYVKSQKFGFVWSTYFSHDNNEDVAILDESLIGLLKEVNNEDGIFNNTILIVMSDHGHRFNSRLHLQGKYEERLPFLSIHLPKSLVTKRPEILQNMKNNENKLITTLDVYASLTDMVNNFTYVYSNNSALYKISLFSSNMPFRSCPEVKVAPHWCTCLKWIEISVNEEVVKEAAIHIIKVINKEIEEYKEKCNELYLDKVLQANLITPSDDVIKFQKSDKDGRIPNMSDNTKIDGIYYRISLQTKPGDANFEATIKARKKGTQNVFTVNIKEVDRSNRYSEWIWCIDNAMKDVRKYCLCK